MPNSIDPARTRLAVLGSPIAHSLSPTMHRAAYEVLGLAFDYDRREVTEDALPGFINDLGPNWRGLSLTMPLKRAVVPMLDRSSALVDELGVANTVVFVDEGGHTLRFGANTDVDGLVRPVQALGHVPGEATIVGGGATATSALVACERLGAQLVRVFVRDPERAADLIELATRIGVSLEIQPLSAIERAGRFGFVISTLPGGAADGLPLHPSGSDAVLFDVAYEPWPTAIARAWAAEGGRVLNGLDMLTEQAIGQIRVFTGGDVETPLPDEAAVRRAMRASVGLDEHLGGEASGDAGAQTGPASRG